MAGICEESAPGTRARPVRLSSLSSLSLSYCVCVVCVWLDVSMFHQAAAARWQHESLLGLFHRPFHVLFRLCHLGLNLIVSVRAIRRDLFSEMVPFEPSQVFQGPQIRSELVLVGSSDRCAVERATHALGDLFPHELHPPKAVQW